MNLKYPGCIFPSALLAIPVENDLAVINLETLRAFNMFAADAIFVRRIEDQEWRQLKMKGDWIRAEMAERGRRAEGGKKKGGRIRRR